MADKDEYVQIKCTNHSTIESTFVCHECGKPYCEAYKKASDLLNIIPTRMLVIEDSIESIKTVKTLGMKVIAIRNNQQIDFEEADYVIDSIEELLTF